MNPRILKKLTRKAEPIIIALGLTKGLERVESGPDGDVETCCTVDRKHRWRSRNVAFSHHFNQMHGTVGYGCVSGYDEPEWDDDCCWSILAGYVFESFTDWENYNGEDGGPKNHCPHKLKRNTAAILKYSRELAFAKRERSLQ